MRDFRRWCDAVGLDPEEFFVPGAGYVVPQEFLNWWYNTAFKEYVRYGRVERINLAKAVITSRVRRRAENVAGVAG